MSDRQSQTPTLDDLYAMMRDPRYWNANNPERQSWVDQVTSGFQALYPDSGHGDAGRQSNASRHGGLVHVTDYMKILNGLKVHVSEHNRAWPSSRGRSDASDHSVVGNVPKAPPGVDIDRDIQEAEKHMAHTVVGDIWFYYKVHNKGPWDFKRRSREYERFGNFHYGATGASMGYSLDTLQRMAGWYQFNYSKSEPTWGKAPSLPEAYLGIGGEAPFRDDPADQKDITNGYDYYFRKVWDRKWLPLK